MTDLRTHRVFVALADPTRRLLFQQLCEEGSGTATSFAARLPLTRQAVTKHLETLAGAGLVTAHEEGRERRYVPQPESLQAVTAWIAEVEASWDTRLAALRGYLLDEPKHETSLNVEKPTLPSSQEERIQEHGTDH